jgi:hypothetical protein
MGHTFTVGTVPVSIAAEGRRTALIVSNRGLQPSVFKIGEAGGTLTWSNGVCILQPGGTLTVDTARAARMAVQAVVQSGSTTLAVQEVF